MFQFIVDVIWQFMFFVILCLIYRNHNVSHSSDVKVEKNLKIKIYSSFSPIYSISIYLIDLSIYTHSIHTDAQTISHRNSMFVTFEGHGICVHSVLNIYVAVHVLQTCIPNNCMPSSL